MRDMIEFQWERTKFFDTDAVLEILPTPLRTQVLLDMNKTFMFTVPFFQDQDEAIIKEIVQVLGHELILPGTLVVHEGQPADKMFFTRFGRFEVLAPHSFVVVQSIGIGGYFGEIGLLVNHGRYSATVRASPTTRCEVATLSRANLDKLMNTFPVFSRSFKRVGLSRLRSTRNDFLKSRFSGQTEYRIVFEIIKGHNLMPDEDQGVVMAEVVTRTCKKKRKNDNQNQKDGGDGGDGGFAAAAGNALLDGDGRRQAGDQVDVGAFELLDELAGVGGHAVEEAALAFGEEDVEGEGGFAGAGEAGDDDELVAGDLQVYVL